METTELGSAAARWSVGRISRAWYLSSPLHQRPSRLTRLYPILPYSSDINRKDGVIILYIGKKKFRAASRLQEEGNIVTGGNSRRQAWVGPLPSGKRQCL